MNNRETRPLGSGSIEQLTKLSFERDSSFLSVQTKQEQLIQQINVIQLIQNSDMNSVNEWQRKDILLKNAIKCKTRLYEMRKSLIKIYRTLLSLVQNLLHVLDNELSRLKLSQQLKGNGVFVKNSLSEIQEFCITLSEEIWLTMAQMKQLLTMANNMPTIANREDSRYVEKVESLIKSMTSLFTHYMNSAFIIDEQPPQVLKTNSPFTASVRLMVSDKIPVHLCEPKMKIITESQTKSMFKKNSMPLDETSGQEVIITSAMVCKRDSDSVDSQLSFRLKDIRIDNINRKGRKGKECVTEEKFGFIIQCEASVGEGELTIGVTALSVPIVVVVHVNQAPKAWGTIALDTAFATPGRQAFAVEDRVPFSRLADVLSDKFMSSTGKELSAKHRRFLAEKLFGRKNLINWFEKMTSGDLFIKTPLPEIGVSFWKWFYAILNFSEKYLRDLWKDGLVMGFVSRRQTQELLSRSPIGTFFIKYSDSTLGSITIPCVGQGDNGVRAHTWFGPIDENDINNKKIADIVKDLHDLKYLYPGSPKDGVFAGHYSTVMPMSNNTSLLPYPYVKPVLIMTVTESVKAPFVSGQQRSFPVSCSLSSSAGSICSENTDTDTAMDVESGSEEITENELNLFFEESMKVDPNNSLDFSDSESIYCLFADSKSNQ